MGGRGQYPRRTMILPATVAFVGAVVAGAFAAQLAAQFRARRRPHALAWALSLALYAVGMVALAAGFALAWTPAGFGVYWLAGALLNVPLLAVGQLHLLWPDKTPIWWTLAGLATIWALVAVVTTPVDASALAAADATGGIPLGGEAYGGGLAWTVLRPLTFGGAVVVLAGTIWSGVRTRRPGILLISLGVAFAASSSAFVRAGYDELVAVVLTLGVAIMYAGFRSASKPSRRPSSDRTQASSA